LTDGREPECSEKALDNEEKQKWLDAIKDEIKSLHDNHTYALENMWIFRVKQEAYSTSRGTRSD